MQDLAGRGASRHQERMCLGFTLTMVSEKNSLNPASSFDTAKPTAPKPPTAAARNMIASDVGRCRL